MGFRLGTHLYTFVITGPLDQFQDLKPTLAGSWYLTMGDSDGDMWAEAQRWKMGREATRPAAGSAR
jgi:hypothetical protein